MSEDSALLLKEISHKLSLLISLIKIANRDLIRKAKEEISKDPVFSKVLEISDGTLPAVQFKQRVANETKVSEKTVERRISELLEIGALTVTRRGKEIYYENSGLLD